MSPSRVPEAYRLPDAYLPTGRSKVIEPGLVVIRAALAETEQQTLFRAVAGSRFLPAETANRERVYDRVEAFDAAATAACVCASTCASQADAAMPNMFPTHLLANRCGALPSPQRASAPSLCAHEWKLVLSAWPRGAHCDFPDRYSSTSGLVWHRDIYRNDGDGDAPIVILSLGAPCQFGVESVVTGERRVIELRSGDALVFGGPCRFIKHAVLSIDLERSPTWMPVEQRARLSLTFREACHRPHPPPRACGGRPCFKLACRRRACLGRSTSIAPSRPSTSPSRSAGVQETRLLGHSRRSKVSISHYSRRGEKQRWLAPPSENPNVNTSRESMAGMGRAADVCPPPHSNSVLSRYRQNPVLVLTVRADTALDGLSPVVPFFSRACLVEVEFSHSIIFMLRALAACVWA